MSHISNSHPTYKAHFCSRNLSHRADRCCITSYLFQWHCELLMTITHWHCRIYTKFFASLCHNFLLKFSFLQHSVFSNITSSQLTTCITGVWSAYIRGTIRQQSWRSDCTELACLRPGGKHQKLYT